MVTQGACREIMKFSVLGSGSKGNAVFIESGATAILIDAGFSGKEIEKRLQAIGKSLENVQAICITHEHSDHINGVGVISRRLKIPAYANEGTYVSGSKKLGKLFRYKEFETGDGFEIGDLFVKSYRISHDTADPVGYVISDGVSSLGYCTDTGKVSHLMEQRLSGCNGLILEFNHDLKMLKYGPYPLPLQQRVRSSVGHLCNEDAAEFLQRIIGNELKYLVQAHLSENNNLPELASRAIKNVNLLEARVLIASQSQPLELLEL